MSRSWARRQEALAQKRTAARPTEARQKAQGEPAERSPRPLPGGLASAPPEFPDDRALLPTAARARAVARFRLQDCRESSGSCAQRYSTPPLGTSVLEGDPQSGAMPGTFSSFCPDKLMSAPPLPPDSGRKFLICNRLRCKLRCKLLYQKNLHTDSSQQRA